MDRDRKPESIQAAVPLLSQPKWLSLSHATRAKLVELFRLKRSGATETYMGRDSMVRVVSDGYEAKDLMAVNLEAMQTILDTDRKDFYELFDEIVANIDVLLNPEKEIVEIIEVIPEQPKRRGRPRKVI